MLPSGFLTMPFGIVAGLSVAKTGKYRKQLWLGWACLILAHGLYSTMTADTSNARNVGFQTFSSMGLGIIVSCAVFPILAPISNDLNSQALSFFMFIRFLAQVDISHFLPVNVSELIHFDYRVLVSLLVARSCRIN